jgi:hypothetical protein
LISLSIPENSKRVVVGSAGRLHLPFGLLPLVSTPATRVDVDWERDPQETFKKLVVDPKKVRIQALWVGLGESSFSLSGGLLGSRACLRI